ncbi:MAG: polysaccharide biosynthesis/export family protein [Acidobacteriota bacterium]
MHLTHPMYHWRTLAYVLAMALLLARAGTDLQAQTPGQASAEPAGETPTPASRMGGLQEYRLGPGDVLAIDVFGLDELDRKVRVARDGSISLPLLGTFSIADFTLQEAERQIARMLDERQLVIDPQVSIFVEEFVSRAVSIQGAVGRPGFYPLIGAKTLLELIGEAGGVHPDAGEKILVLRADTSGAQSKLEIDTERLTSGGDISLNIFLRPDDIVMVSHAKELNVYVTGAVARPGAVKFMSSEGITVLQAITAAGGPTARANLKKVHVIRQLDNGTQERIKVSVSRIQKGKDDDVVLLKNDTVVVGEWFF